MQDEEVGGYQKVENEKKEYQPRQLRPWCKVRGQVKMFHNLLAHRELGGLLGQKD